MNNQQTPIKLTLCTLLLAVSGISFALPPVFAPNENPGEPPQIIHCMTDEPIRSNAPTAYLVKIKHIDIDPLTQTIENTVSFRADIEVLKIYRGNVEAIKNTNQLILRQLCGPRQSTRDCNKISQPQIKTGEMMVLFGRDETVKEISNGICPNGTHLNTFTQKNVDRFEAGEKYTPIWVRE